jgi:hypothetical protein
VSPTVRYFRLAPSEPFAFATFTCGACGEKQTQVVRVKARTSKCIACEHRHVHAPGEVTKQSHERNG